MNQRSKMAAALFALFLGMFGAHWFYLGNSKTGGIYLAIFCASILLTAVVIGLGGFLVLGAMCLGDFFTLLSMDPVQFDRKYNLPSRP